jgi:hypothetical protein
MRQPARVGLVILPSRSVAGCVSVRTVNGVGERTLLLLLLDLKTFRMRSVPKGPGQPKNAAWPAQRVPASSGVSGWLLGSPVRRRRRTMLLS